MTKPTFRRRLFENLGPATSELEMIGPAELEDILLDLQAAALEAGTTLHPELFHPSFAVPPEAWPGVV